MCAEETAAFSADSNVRTDIHVFELYTLNMQQELYPNKRQSSCSFTLSTVDFAEYAELVDFVKFVETL